MSSGLPLSYLILSKLTGIFKVNPKFAWLYVNVFSTYPPIHLVLPLTYQTPCHATKSKMKCSIFTNIASTHSLKYWINLTRKFFKKILDKPSMQICSHIHKMFFFFHLGLGLRKTFEAGFDLFWIHCLHFPFINKILELLC